MDIESADANDFLAVNQFVVREGNQKRIPDIVVFVNGLPLAVIELKNLANENATIDGAFNQLQTYKAEIPSLFDYNELLVISDGVAAKVGSLTAGLEWFKPWPTIDDEQPVKGKLALETLIRGVFAKSRLLTLVRDFVLFEDDADSGRVFKILAGYHQFHAARKAIDASIKATRVGADHRCGVVWHTQGSGKARWLTHVGNLSKAYALCPVSDYALKIREGVAFFQIIAAMFRKYGPSGKTQSELDLAVRQLVSKAVVTATEDVIDVFGAAGMERPNVSIFSEEFLEEVRALPHKNLAVELLRKLLSDEIKIRHKRNVVQARAFSEMLQTTMNGYHNRAISNQEIIEELINIAHKIKAAADRGEELNLTNDEVCFYDALIQNNSAQELMQDDQLKVIATELVMTVRRNVTIDWTMRESARARIRVIVKRILKKFGYPPDLQDAAVKLVLEQAESLSDEWAESSSA